MQGESFFKVNYEGIEIEIALYEGIEMKDVLEIISNQFNISTPIVSLISNTGIIYSLKYLMQNFLSLNIQNTYTIITKPAPKVNRTLKKEENNNSTNNYNYLEDIFNSQNIQSSDQFQNNQVNTNLNINSNKSYIQNFNVASSLQESHLFKDKDMEMNQFHTNRKQEEKMITTKEENEFLNLLKFLKADNFIDEVKEKFLFDQFLNQNQELMNIWKKFIINNNLGLLKESISKTIFPLFNNYYNTEKAHKFNDSHNFHLKPSILNSNNNKFVGNSSRPLITSVESIRRMPINNNNNSQSSMMTSTQALMIGTIHKLEDSGLLDKQIVSSIKTLILEENEDVFKVMNSYIAHFINETQLCHKLQKLSEKLSTYFERPTSPLPRKESIQSYILNNKKYFCDKEDISLLIKLSNDENEFILAAFDVFEADRDNENLLDTLRVIVERYKRTNLQHNSFFASAFFEGHSIDKYNKFDKPNKANLPFPRASTVGHQINENRKRLVEPDSFNKFDKEDNQLILSDSSSDLIMESNFENDISLKSTVKNDEKILPIIKEEKSKVVKEQKKEEIHIHEIAEKHQPKKKSSNLKTLSYEKFSEINGLDLNSKRDIGMLKYLINNNFRDLEKEYENYIQTNNLEELNEHIQHIISFQFNQEMTFSLNSNEYKSLLEMSIRKNQELLKKYDEFAENGDLKKFIDEFKILANKVESSNQEPSKISAKKSPNNKRLQLIKQTSCSDISEFANQMNIDFNAYPLLQDSIPKIKSHLENSNENKDIIDEEEEMEKLKKLLENSCEVLRENSFMPIETEILEKQFKKKNIIF